jgi:predicted nucleic acid-binding protein
MALADHRSKVVPGWAVAARADTPLLGESRGSAVRDALATAELVLASDLTVLQCHRVLTRAVAAGRLSEADASDLRARLGRTAGHWVLLRVDDDALERARRPFPLEPVRTLDALHLATALAARTAVPEMRLLSLDDRVRGNAAQLGFELLPETSGAS